uniref:response regulator n=1 Tax=Parasutterella excrementihominis TaxID=487175 RepID=UPI003FEDED5F
MNTGETTVLVVEPDLDTQRVYRQRLIHDPDSTLIGICSSIASATALLAQTNCDILFTELNLPDGDGLDFIRRASEDLAVQNIVAVTSKNSAADIATAIETVPSAISRSRTPIFTMSETTFAFSVPTEVRSARLRRGS